MQHTIPKLVLHYTPSTCRLLQYIYDRIFSASVRHYKLTYTKYSTSYTLGQIEIEKSKPEQNNL